MLSPRAAVLSIRLEKHVLPKSVACCTCRGILNSQLFSWLPRGAVIINVSRGAHIVDEDLIAALDSGQVIDFTSL
jgi:phosphoglycerate dehydrogenase-like enzyme